MSSILDKENRLGGLALIVSSVLGIFTMALHPVGGSVERIAKISPMIKGTHGMAIAAALILAYGLVILYRTSLQGKPVALFGLIAACYGLIAVILAGTLNGFALTNMALKAGGTDSESLHTVLSYGHQLNEALAIQYLVCLGFAFVCFGATLPKTCAAWLRISGIVVGLLILVVCMAGADVVGVRGFGLSVTLLSVWAILVGGWLWRVDRA